MNQLRFDMADGRSLLERIGDLSQPETVDSCIPWLDEAGLLRPSRGYRLTTNQDHAGAIPLDKLLAGPIVADPSVRRDQSYLKDLRKRFGNRCNFTAHAEEIWQEHQAPHQSVYALDFHRIPADAIAFYRPFHLTPHHEWGIYILVDRLVSYAHGLADCARNKLFAFSPEMFYAYVLFEMFHHEFFHHLVECAATTIEILSAGFGQPRRTYWDYREHVYENTGVGTHPDKPLEEALANAYAFNSLSFNSRIKFGCKVIQVKLYQALLEKHWPKEPPGYSSAGKYSGSRYIAGAAQLLAMLVASEHLDPAAATLLAKTVLISGHSAFAHKAHIPTYFVGSADQLKQFYELVPAPLESYTSLFTVEDTSEIDQVLNQRKQQARQKGSGATLGQ